jgi:hypothetical protein
LSEFCDGANKPPCPKSNGHTSIPAVAAPHSSVLHCLGGPLEASAQVSRKCQCVAGSGESHPILFILWSVNKLVVGLYI